MKKIIVLETIDDVIKVFQEERALGDDTPMLPAKAELVVNSEGRVGIENATNVVIQANGWKYVDLVERMFHDAGIRIRINNDQRTSTVPTKPI